MSTEFIEPVVYHGQLVEILDDGRWRFRGLTFETVEGAQYYIDWIVKLERGDP
jgi:hypothetical protein